MNDAWKKALKRKAFAIPREDAIKDTIESFSPAERVLFAFICLIFAGSVLVLVQRLNHAIMVEVPASGGALVEGIVGTPRFVNPLLALSDADRDLSSLLYSGLLRVSAEGTLVPDLAESYEISEDGLTYTVVLKQDAVFHDGKPVTADDVVYTVTSAENGALKSPKRANWEGVTVAKIDDQTVAFKLKQPYAPFLENLTLGILPVHLWKDVDPNGFPFSQLNVEPVGSGPYRLLQITRSSSGIPEAYVLVPFRRATIGMPYISELTLRFYANEGALIRAYNDGEIESASGLSPDNLPAITKKGGLVVRSPLPRVFGLFFNQNQKAFFADKNVRAALDLAVNKDRIVKEVLQGYGSAIESPFPPGTLPGSAQPVQPAGDQAAASALLEKAGWTVGEDGIRVKGKAPKVERLSFSIATSDTPELKKAAEEMAEELKAIGVEVTVKVFEPGDLNQNVIRPRNYEALFFGEVVGREFDLFAFWHSSQRNDPGLNIALYANITADKLLEEARAETDTDVRMAKYLEFDTLLRSETPAVLVYAPDFLYIVPQKIEGRVNGPITTPNDRFNDIEKWHTETEWIWPWIQKVSFPKDIPYIPWF